MKRKSKTSRLAVNLLIGLSSVALPLLAFDLLMKYSRFDVQRVSRQMFLVSSYISNQNNLKFRHYSPYSSPTQVTVVNDKVEYQYQFSTDKWGFRTTYRCTNQVPPDRLISIHGDSFMEGQGVAKPWIVALQKSLCLQGFDSVNMAMPGNGILDFQASINLANSLSSNAPKVVAAIDHDFFRESFNVKPNDNCSRYYIDTPKENDCLTAKVIWTHIGDVSEIPDQLKIAKKRKAYGLIPFAHSVTRKLKRNLDQRFAFSYSLYSPIYKQSISALTGYLKNNLSPVLLVRLPMQTDILSSEASAEHSSNLANIAQTFPNIHYLDLAQTCSLTSNDYFDNDPHPNQLGHNKLSSCLLSSDVYRQFVHQLSP